MDINNVSTFITLDPSKLFNAERFYNRAMVMYEGDEDLVESFLKEHLASDSLAYAMHLLEETSSTSYMGVKIHYNGTSFSAPTAGVYGVKSRPEIKARIKAKVLKRNDQQNKAASLRKEDATYGYDSKGRSKNPKDIKKREAKKEEVEIVDEGKGKKEPRWQDDDCDGKWYEKSDVDGKISDREKKEKKKHYNKEDITDILARLEKKRIRQGGNPDESPLGKKTGRAMKAQQDKSRKKEEKKESVEVNHIDGSKTQIIDVIKAPKMPSAASISEMDGSKLGIGLAAGIAGGGLTLIKKTVDTAKSLMQKKNGLGRSSIVSAKSA